jgi:hypothetical protein
VTGTVKAAVGDPEGLGEKNELVRLMKVGAAAGMLGANVPVAKDRANARVAKEDPDRASADAAGMAAVEARVDRDPAVLVQAVVVVEEGKIRGIV